MAIDGTSMRLILETRRRLNQIRTPLLEAIDDGNIGALGQSLTAAWMDLRTAFVALETTLAAITPKGDPVWPPKESAVDEIVTG